MTLPALSPFSPLGRVLDDIRRSIEAKLYYPALLVTLTIPEICVALTLDKAVFIKEIHYAGWINKYTQQGSPNGLGLTGVDCYRLRGGVVHRANFAGHPKVDWTNVVFTIPETGGGAHGFSVVAGEKKAAMLDLILFCNAMINGALQWYEDHKDDKRVKSAMSDMIRWCPAGLQPFCGGAPVVASGP